MTTPYWVQDAVFYQIFPDRFSNGDPDNDPPNVQPWGSPPTIWGFQGGDLRGIIARFDYLLDLGINAIYLNPIFHATSNHRYNATDYFTIEPKLGTLNDFDALLDVAHANGVRVVLDGVFNHCGRGFFAFNDLLENGQHSPYKDWFLVNKFPLDAYGEGEANHYQAWWSFKSLPKFNHANPKVRRYLLDVARYWIERGADGWRLDVPNEIDDDTFWAEFRREVKSVNPDAYLVGEIWEADKHWVGEDHFDGLMHYPLRKALLEAMTSDESSVEAFSQTAESLIDYYGHDHAYAHYVLLGTHDTERVRTLLGGESEAVKQAMLFQFFYPGAPAIYYGDEIGLEGEKDPDSRRAFPWDESQWDLRLRAFVQRLIEVRKSRAVLRRGDFRVLHKDERSRTCGFGRVLGGEAAALALNFSTTSEHIELPVDGLGWQDGSRLQDAVGTHEATVQDGRVRLEMAPRSGVLLVSRLPD